MKVLRWSFKSNDATAAHRRRPRRQGFYDPRAPEAGGIFTLFSPGTVRSPEGDRIEVAPGERVRVLSAEDLAKHAGSDWVYLVVDVPVRYGGEVECLVPDTPIAVLPKDMDL